FDQLMRIVVEQHAVLEGAGFTLVTVANQVNGFTRFAIDEAPLHASGKACATAATQTAGLDLVDDGGRVHRERFAQRLVAALLYVLFEAASVTWFADVAEQHAL